MLAILFLTLARRLGKKEIVFGIPLLNRRTEEEKNTIGCFINIIPLKISYKPELTFNELVKIIKSEVRSTIPYRNVSNHEINQALGVNFSNTTQLYDVLFAFEKNNYDLHFGDVTVFESGTLSNDYIQTPLVVHWFDFHEKGPVKLAWDYNLKYLSESEVVRFDNCFQAIYDHFLQSQSDSLKNAPYLNQVELAQIDVAAKGEKHNFPSVGLVERIQSVVNAKPDATALVDEFGELTYKQLWANAQKAANELILKGAQDGEPVAILLPRSKDYVVSIVSILVAGAYYVPIDVDLPQERINAMLTEAGIKFVLTNKSISSRTELKHTIAIEIDRELRSKEGFLVPSRDRLDPAYCIFTSGTTGTPKGVLISSESVLNLIDSLNSHVYSHYPETTKLGLLSAFHFDASIQQIFACLILGFELNIISEQDRKDGSRLATALSNNHIEICDGVPTHISAMIGATSQGQRQFPVKHFLLGGEKLTSDLLLKFNDWLPEQNIRISNLYGPTETTVDATIHTFNTDEIQERDTISIGRPLHHINVWIVDEEGYPLPPNTEGEIVIGGKGIALGYLNQPELTAQKFKYNEVLRSLVYHSGDKGFFDQEGKFFIKGRIDNQVKIRGYRIELADIEHNLTKINGVEEALVLVHSHGEIPKLLAFVTGQKAPLGKLKEKLKRHLPDYMIPNHIYNLTAFPLNKTGKIDRSRLIDLTTIKKAGKNTDKLFLSVTERSLLDIYKEILEVDFVDVNEGFFDLGGDSLSLVFSCQELKKSSNKNYQ